MYFRPKSFRTIFEKRTPVYSFAAPLLGLAKSIYYVIRSRDKDYSHRLLRLLKSGVSICFPFLQVFVHPKNLFPNQADSFPVQISPRTSLNTADVSGISQFPVGTLSKSASNTLSWAARRVEPVLPSQMLLLMMAGSHSSCMVRLFLIQCTLWGIPFWSYSHLSPISIQDLTHRTWPLRISQVCLPIL